MWYPVYTHVVPGMYMLYPYNKKNRYMIQCTRRVSGITFIRYMYTYRQAIGKPTNLKDLAASKSKDVSTIAKLGKGYLCKREIDLREII